VVTLSLTTLSWFLLERPLMLWSKRLEARRYMTPAATPGVAPPAAPDTSTALSASASDGAAREAMGYRKSAEQSGSVEGPSP
jgi:hypothetical protein